MRPRNLPEGVEGEINECLQAANQEFGFTYSLKGLLDRVDRIETFQPDSNTEAGWKDFWRQQLLADTSFNNLEEFQAYLQNQDKRVLFIIDGAEEIFQKASESPRERMAVRALCQGMVNELRSIPNGRIGLLILIRHDVVYNAIEQNWGQFYAQYSSFELRWTPVEALRLAAWIISSVDKTILKDITIEVATRETLETALYPLWGVKLGKPDSNEAYSTGWILVALSDLNQQMQARDMVRFLKYAAIESLSSQQGDRYLAPAAIRKAIQPCSTQKIKEIRQEMQSLSTILDSLQNSEGQKIIPFQIEDFGLTIREATLLEHHGYLTKLDDGYYLPEIIRHGLGFKLPKGARPKVLALLKGHNPKNKSESSLFE